MERFHRADPDRLELDVTFDDPKAYTKPWTGKGFKLTHTGMGRYMWVCDVKANLRFDSNFERPAAIPAAPQGK